MKPEESTDWFATAANQAAASDQARRVAVQIALMGKSAEKSATEISRAAAAFTAAAGTGAPIISPNDPPPWASVPSGGIGVTPGRTSGGARYGAVTQPSASSRRPTPEEGLDAIVRHIEGSSDADEAFKRAGEWITRITNAITTASRYFEDEH